MLEKINRLYKEREKKHVKYPIYGLIAIFLTVIHLSVLDLISVAGMTPDLLIILCVWIALKEGQFVGILFAFGIGLFYDVVSFDVEGTNALTKMITAFIAGFYYQPNQANLAPNNFTFVIMVFFCSLAHNLVYFLFYLDLTQIPFFTFFLKYGLSLALYTTVFATFIMLIQSIRKRKISTKFSN